jgi:hypothetical protein
VGGSIEKAVKGEYQIDVKTVWLEAWQLTKSCRQPFNFGVLAVLMIGILASMLASYSVGGVQVIVDDPKLTMLLNIVLTIIIWPFLAGVEMMGVLHAIGLNIKTGLIFAFLKRGSWVALCALTTSLLISLGLQLFILPGVFLAVVFSLTIPLVVEKRLSPWRAMVISIQALRYSWIKLLQLYLLLMGILLLSFLPVYLLLESQMLLMVTVMFIFCLSYLTPMFYHVKGILYRDIFGLSCIASKQDKPAEQDDIFSA